MGTTSPPRSCTCENGVNYACLWGKNDNVVGEDNDDGPMPIRRGASMATFPIDGDWAITEVLGRIACVVKYFHAHSPDRSFYCLCHHGDKDTDFQLNPQMKRASSKIQKKRVNLRVEYRVSKVPSYIVSLSDSDANLTLVSDSAITSFEDIHGIGNNLKIPNNQNNAVNHSTSVVAVSTCPTQKLSSNCDPTLLSLNTLLNQLTSQFQRMSTPEKEPYKHRLQSLWHQHRYLQHHQSLT